jgi:hypothetical protein
VPGGAGVFTIRVDRHRLAGRPPVRGVLDGLPLGSARVTPLQGKSTRRRTYWLDVDDVPN